MAAQPIYRYFSERRYAEAFIAGQIRFCSLDQYRAMENDAARGDRLEGQRLHRPSSGLVLNMADGRNIETPWTFSSTANTRDIFVLCTSLKLAPEMFELFKASSVVVIRSPGQLKSRINDALGQRYRSKPWELMSGAVSYYCLEDSPGIDWVPHRAAFCKLSNGYADQAEMRFAFGLHGAFHPSKVKVELHNGESSVERVADFPAPITLQAKAMDRFCTLVDR